MTRYQHIKTCAPHATSSSSARGGARRGALLSGFLLLALAGPIVTPASAGRVENPVAIFAALDKVTARISKLEVPLNQTVEFGSLKVTPRVCFTRDPTEPPKTSTFVEVNETELNGQEKRVFSGWMFAESPGLNAVEHPVFDVWLTGCEGGAATTAATDDQQGETEGETRQTRRRRVRQ